MKLEEELIAAQMLDVKELAETIVGIGFECTDCGACCKGGEEEHTATIFPSEIRKIQNSGKMEWRDIARPMPFGVRENEKGELVGETFEWALQIGECGDCSFYRETDGKGMCSIYGFKPLICETYPFSVDLGGSSNPKGEVVEKVGDILIHECEGVGREIEYKEAMKMAEVLKERTIREIEESIQLVKRYRSLKIGGEKLIVHDSEGAKNGDGKII
ncbi:MAG: YkgJ family cysteine cluster protein [Halobacteriales archaeon]|nr:YkgJ family cysteine cluster protein [Halobacteriales archaeon]